MTPPEGCHRYREQIGAFLLDKLDEGEFEAVRMHLNGCPDCCAEAGELGPVVAALAEADPDRIEEVASPPGDLEESTLAPILGEIHLARRRGRRLWWSAVAAAICVLAIGLAGFAWFLEPGVALEPLSFSDEAPGVDVRGGMIAHDWGTEIRLDASGLRYCQTYTVTLVSEAGKRVNAGTFFGAGDETVSRTFESKLSREDADRLEVRTPGGKLVSFAKLPEDPRVADRGLPSLGGILPWADPPPPNEKSEACDPESTEAPGAEDTSPDDPREQPGDPGSGGGTPPPEGRKPGAASEGSGPVGGFHKPPAPTSPPSATPAPRLHPCELPPDEQPPACHQYDRQL